MQQPQHTPQTQHKPKLHHVVQGYLETIRGKVITTDDLMKHFDIPREKRGHLREILSRLSASTNGNIPLTTPVGNREGIWKVLYDIKPIKWMDADEDAYFPLAFPRSHEDGSSFGFEDLITISPGDLIVIAGVSNYGKTALVLNLLGENVDTYECVLMGNEQTTLDQKPSPKFKRRMKRMNWVNWVNDEGELKFQLYPIGSDYEAYIPYLAKDKFLLIDWLMLPENFWGVQTIMYDIKAAIGQGVVAIVQQKTRGKEFADGGEFSERFADVYLKIDPFGKRESRLTVGKVKDAKQSITGRMWAFEIVDGGANLHNIRELEKCRTCWGKCWKKAGNTSVPCDNCSARGYVDK